MAKEVLRQALWDLPAPKCQVPAPEPWPRPTIHGPGVTAKDKERLGAQMERVLQVMSDGKWRTLAAIAANTFGRFGKVDSEAGISARLRDCRKDPLNLTVDKRRANEGGQYEYKVSGMQPC